MSSATEPSPSMPVVHFQQAELTFRANNAEPLDGSVQIIEQDLGSADDFYNIQLDLVFTFSSKSEALTVPFDNILTIRNLSATDPPSLHIHLRAARSLGTLVFTNQAAAVALLRAFAGHAHLSRLSDPALPQPLFSVDPFPRMRRAAPSLGLAASSPSSQPSGPYPNGLDPADTTALLADLTLDTPSNTSSAPPHKAFALDLLTHFARVTKTARDFGDRISAVLDEDRRRARESVQNALAAGTQALDAYATLVASAGPVDVDLPPVLKLDTSSRHSPLSKEGWSESMDADEKLSDPTVVRYAIFSGGVDPALRSDVWPFLLGVYPWHSTREERVQLLKTLQSDYETLKLKWQNVYDDAVAKAESEPNDEKKQATRPTPRDLPTDPLERVLRVHEQVAKDVVRTDRGIPLYEADNAPATALMATLLNVYATHDARTAYCQGMSDFLSPLLHVFATGAGGSTEDVDEALLFWSFEGLMRRMEANFRVDQTGMRAQLSRLREVLRAVDPELAAAFADADPEYYACFRWMLVRFKRELAFDDTQRLWEVLWTRIVGDDELHIFVAAGLLVAHRRRLLALRKGAFDALLRYVNDMSMRIDVEFAVREGEMCYRKFVEMGGNVPTR